MELTPNICDEGTGGGRVILWCVPRSRSTVLTRCIGDVEGTSVWFTNFGTAHWVSSLYHSQTGKVLPEEYQRNKEAFDEAVKIVKRETGQELHPDKLGYADIKRQLESDGSRYVLVKEQAFAMDSPKAFSFIPAGFKHVFLIRDPSHAFTSHRKGIIADMQQTGLMKEGIHPFNMITDDPFSHPHSSLLKRQYELWKYVRDNIDPDCLIIDSFDLVSKPRVILKEFGRRTGIPFSDSLLSWTQSSMEKAGWKTPGEAVQKQDHFFGAAMTSTHFVAPPSEEAIPRDQLTDDVRQCVDASMPFYLELHKHRFKA